MLTRESDKQKGKQQTSRVEGIRAGGLDYSTSLVLLTGDVIGLYRQLYTGNSPALPCLYLIVTKLEGIRNDLMEEA